jgi:hypothetical protein
MESAIAKFRSIAGELSRSESEWRSLLSLRVRCNRVVTVSVIYFSPLAKAIGARVTSKPAIT